MKRVLSRLFVLSVYSLCTSVSLCVRMDAQTVLTSLPTLPAAASQAKASPLTISREVTAGKPLSVVGPRGALLGDQSGAYEAWIFPWKIFSGMRITANMENYPVPIDVNDHAAQVDVQPDRTTITYSHANFTVRQILMAPKKIPEGDGVLVFYQVQAVRPMTLTFSFDPVMQRMWPAASDDIPSPEWVPTAGGSGFYILHENFPEHAAALAMPGAQPGILPPYQERARAWPLQFVLHFDPASDSSTTFPLLITLANTRQAATQDAFAKSLLDLDAASASIAEGNAAYYQALTTQHTSIETPDQNLNAAFSWAEIAIDQLRVQTTPGYQEEALTAGFVASGDAARPGFGWYFGRDALWSLYAVNSYGGFDVTRGEIEFLLHRQRSDGKIMHEWSQTADLVDWKSLPYEYASADATPLLLMAVNDYLKISGDEAFLRSHWPQLELAWAYETSHVSSDGIYDNSSGTAWVESWVPSMPYQEIYLATVDEQASLAFANLASIAGHSDLAAQATQRAAKLRPQIEKDYFLPATGFYAFSHNPDGTADETATVFPSVAWWDGDYSLEHGKQMFPRLASSEFSTDWGARILSDRTRFYDPISYHQGTVWPLFTGWLSVAEYRAGSPLSGYLHLMQNANLTFSQDLGSATELLSGQLYQVLGRSTAHQLWSSAMVISPVLRGMFGLEWDAAHHVLSVTPHLPADWQGATIRQLPLGDTKLTLTLSRRAQDLVVEVAGDASAQLRLQSHADGARVQGHTLHIPLPALEVAVKQRLPAFGQETQQMKVLGAQDAERRLTLILAAPGSSRETLMLRENTALPHLHSADVSMDPKPVSQPDSPGNGLKSITVDFPAGQGYVTKTIQFDW